MCFISSELLVEKIKQETELYVFLLKSQYWWNSYFWLICKIYIPGSTRW